MTEIEQLRNELKGVYEVNAALQEEIVKLTSGKPSTVSGHPFQASGFELDGEKYGFNYPQTRHKGQLITHVEIAADETLQRTLIGMGAGIIKKIQ